MSGNPYNKLNPLAFLIRKAAGGARGLFIIDTSAHNAFDVCNFRRYLVDFLMEETKGKWDLRNDGNNLRLEVEAGWDETMLRENFSVA